MKLQRYITAAAFILAALFPATSQAKGDAAQRIHMFGFAASFNDTIVHFTNIQTVDSVWIDGKTKFLMGRQYYSMMLRDYLNKNELPYRTCVVFYDRSMKKLQKKYIKLKKLYLGNGKKIKNRNNVNDIMENDFKFTAVNTNPQIEEETGQKPAKKKKK